MKKSVDLFLRFIIVTSIMGAIGYYYYTKFTKPVVPVLKSEIVILPVPESKQSSPLKTKSSVKNIKQDNNSVKNINKTDIASDNTTKTNKISEEIFVENIPSNNLYSKLTAFLKDKQIKFNSNSKKVAMKFTRVLLGPFQTKTSLIKQENSLKNLKIETMRLKLKNYYYINVASFTKQNKLKEFLSFLNKHKINNIKFMKITLPREVYSVTISNMDKSNGKAIETFLKSLDLDYTVSEKTIE